METGCPVWGFGIPVVDEKTVGPDVLTKVEMLDTAADSVGV